MSEAKPFCISKWEVWEAYKRVKANQGAAGVDEQTIADFERNLKRNLYKIWNRMSSGSYFPPPVRTVKIPGRTVGKGRSGIQPCRIGSRRGGEVERPAWTRCSIPIPTGIDREVGAGCRGQARQDAGLRLTVDGHQGLSTKHPQIC